MMANINYGRKFTNIFLAATFSLFTFQVGFTQKNIEGVFPGEDFTYGIHQFKWMDDTNANQIMEIDEVQLKRNNQWTNFNSSNKKEQLLFNETIVYRRQQRFFESDCYVYKKTDTRDLMLYVDYPQDWKKSDKRPAIIWFFGGGWNTGNVLHLKPQSDYFTSRGVLGIRVDYRVTIRDGFKDGGYTSTMDAKTAVRWVKKNASSLGIDPDRIILAGASAGGHLALATQISTLNDMGDDTSITTSTAAMILQNPYVVKLNPKSWIFQLDFKELPPVWVAYGTNDQAAYIDDPKQKKTKMNGETFIKKLTNPHKTFIQEGAGHGFCSFRKYITETTLDADTFLQKEGVLNKGKANSVNITLQNDLKAELNKKIAKGELPLTVPKTGIPVHSSIITH